MAGLVPVILAGGRGERFWPLSRTHRPKQFLCLDGTPQSLLQATAERLLPLGGGWGNLWVVTAGAFAPLVQAQLPQLPPENLLLEPEGRDTGPAVTWATLEIARCCGPETVIGFFPADHWIPAAEEFRVMVRQGVDLAQAHSLIVTLGIKPTQPATGYGYIQQGESISQDPQAYRVKRFTEKPDLGTAQGFLAAGGYHWNGGMFIFPATVALAELALHASDILTPLQQHGVAAYTRVPRRSIDYALMEHTQRAGVLPVAFPWDDLGDWNALERLLGGDGKNVTHGHHVGLDTYGSIFYNSQPEELIVTIGLEDLVVVRDGKGTLIAHKSRTQELKQVLAILRQHPYYSQLL